MITIQAKIRDSRGIEFISHFGKLFATVMHHLFKDFFLKKGDINELKRFYQRDFGINARQFNSVFSVLKGKVQARNENYQQHIKDLNLSIKKTEKTVEKLKKNLASLDKKIEKISSVRSRFRLWRAGKTKTQPKVPKTVPKENLEKLIKERKQVIHKIEMKTERVESLKKKLLVVQKRADKISLCFGSEALFKAQHNLSAAGFGSFKEWKEAWRLCRQGSSYWIGSKSETLGNLNAQYDFESKSLSLRVPACWENKYGKRISIGLEFHSEDQEKLLACLDAGGAIGFRFVEKIDTSRKGQKKIVYDANGQFVSYQTSLYCYASFEETSVTPPITTSFDGGAIGIDYNADHLAVVETDKSGNAVNNFSLPFNFKGKTRHQREAILRDYIADIVDYAKNKGKSISYEGLDFSDCKKALREKGRSPVYNQMISEFAYKKFTDFLRSRCHKLGVKAKGVNPAYTSVIGACKFSGYHHLSFHECAALVIARRALNYSERPKAIRHATLPARIADQPLGRVTDFLQKRKSGHVWSFWRFHTKSIRCQIRECSAQSQRTVGNIGEWMNPSRPSGLFAMLDFLVDRHFSHHPGLFLTRLADWQGASLS